MFGVSVVILDARQKRAEELRRLTDQSASMSEEQLTELRADIKVDWKWPLTSASLCVADWGDYYDWLSVFCCSAQHFVSERKYDEDLGKAVRFTFDLEPLKTSISTFGSGNERPSLASLSSS